MLVSDYGRGVAAEPTVRAALARCAPSSRSSGTPPAWTRSGPGRLLVTPNAAEAGAAPAAPPRRAPPLAPEARARALRGRWRAVDVCVTLGARGALLVGAHGPALAVPAPPTPAGDPCGAGDCFAATAAGRLAAGALPSEAVRAAVAAASAFVAAGGRRPGGAGRARARRAPSDAARSLRRVRGQGGTVVATGGCFDLLHAGTCGRWRPRAPWATA